MKISSVTSRVAAGNLAREIEGLGCKQKLVEYQEMGIARILKLLDNSKYFLSNKKIKSTKPFKLDPEKTMEQG